MTHWYSPNQVCLFAKYNHFIWPKTLSSNFVYSTMQLTVTINYHVFPWFNFGTVTYLFGTDWSSANVTFTATIWKASKRSTVHQDDWSLLFVWKQNLSNEIKKVEGEDINNCHVIKSTVFCYQNCSDLLWKNIVLYI